MKFFVGRTTELAQITDLVKNPTACTVINIVGEGGTGKTSLVLKAMDQLDQIEGVKSVLIDFDRPANRTTRAIQGAVVKALQDDTSTDVVSKSVIAEYDDVMAALLSLEASGSNISQSVVYKWKSRADEAFIKLLKRPPYRLVIVLDTVERIQDTYLFQDLLQLFSQAVNIVLVICCRNNEPIKLLLQQQYGLANLHEIFIKPFTEDEAGAYFEQTRFRSLDPNLRKRFWLLTGGKPILLALTQEWLAKQFSTRELRRNPSDVGLFKIDLRGRELLEAPLENLRANLEENQKVFEQVLANNICALRTDVEYAVLVMSLMEHPSTPETFQEVLKIPAEQAQSLVEKLSQKFYVRLDLTLHDEMRRIVQDKVWPVLDPKEELKTKFLNLLLLFAEKGRKDQNDTQRWLSEAEELDYRLSLYVNDGYEFFIRSFDRARDYGFIVECQLLLQTIQSRAHLEQLNISQRVAVRIRVAHYYSLTGQVGRTRPEIAELEQLLQRADIEDAVKIDTYCTLAFDQRNIDLEASATLYEKALELARSSGEEITVARVMNWAGMVYRRLGKFETAALYYDGAIRIYDRYNCMKEKAAVQNNLAYTYRQSGNFDLGMHLARMAFMQRQKIKDRLGLGYSYITIGEFYRDRKDLQSALDNFREALDIFRELKNEQNEAYVWVQIANIQRKFHKPAEVEDAIKRGIDIYTRLDDSEGMAMALNEYGCELRKRGRELGRGKKDVAKAIETLALAESYFIKADEYCRKTQNWYRLADNQADLSLLYRYMYDLCLARKAPETECQEYAAKLQNAAYQALIYARRHGFILHENRAMESLGDLYYSQGKYFKAFAQYYLPACLLMAAFYEKSLWRFQQVFDRVHRHLLNANIPDEEIRFIAQYMVRRWQEEGKDKIAPGFIYIYRDIAEFGVSAVQ